MHACAHRKMRVAQPQRSGCMPAKTHIRTHNTCINRHGALGAQIASEGLNEMRRVDEEHDGENSVLVNVPLDSQIECVMIWGDTEGRGRLG